MVDIGDLFEALAQSFIPVFTEYGTLSSKHWQYRAYPDFDRYTVYPGISEP